MISRGANELTMSPPLVAPPQRRLHILLVEDNPGDAELVRDTLAGAADRVGITHVDSLAGARERLAERHVDVVLLDLSLPDAMGLEGVERLRLAAPDVPIVVLTGIHDEALGARALQAGAQDYLVKGESDERLLMRAMRYAIERHQVHAERTRLLAHEHAARIAAEAQRERAAFLAEVGQRLAGSLDDAGLDERLAEVATLAVPRFADCCVITRLHAVRRKLVAIKHVAPDQEELVRAHYRRAGESATAGADEPSVASEPLVSCDDAAQLGTAHEPWRSAMLRALGATSVMTAPLRSHQGTEGAMTFLHTAASGRVHGLEDRAMMQELGRSASLAIENARLYDEVRRAVGLREEFVAIASHELRTPLTTLTLQLESLRNLLVEVPEPLRERLMAKHTKLQKQAARLDHLVSDLLDVAQSSATHPALDLQRVDLRQLARQVAERLAEVAASAGCQVELQGSEPVVGRWDPRRLDQLLTNLVSNALKYGKGKPVEITCSLDERAALLSVRDHGIGIATADAKRVFERFERAVSARQFSGLGLGLHIARSIAVAHGGTISVSSELGQGATFQVRLPQTPPPRIEESPGIS
jgi:signal transduction histidine kinase/CheY-like chemotaxis protein